MTVTVAFDFEYVTMLKLEKGSVESTHKVPTSYYHTKHCHAVVAPLGGLTHRRGFSRIRPPPPVPAILHLSAPMPVVRITGLPVPPCKYDLSPVPGPWGT